MSDVSPQQARTSKSGWVRAVADYLPGSPWAVLGAFLVGIFVGGSKIVDAGFGAAQKFGILPYERLDFAVREAKDRFSRDLIILIGTRSWRARRVLLGEALQGTPVDQKQNRWHDYDLTVEEWNYKKLYHLLLLDAHYDQRVVKSFTANIDKEFEKIHRCVLLVKGISTPQVKCPRSPEGVSGKEEPALDAAFGWLNQFDSTQAVEFGKLIRPAW